MPCGRRMCVHTYIHTLIQGCRLASSALLSHRPYQTHTPTHIYTHTHTHTHTAACNGSHIKPAEEGSVWLPDSLGHMRVFMCARGYDIIRVPQSPELDRCYRCPAGTYSLAQAFVDESNQASPPEPSCLSCPFGSVCEGTDVVPRNGYWWYDDMMCPTDACQVHANGASKCDVPKCFLQNAPKAQGTRRVLPTSVDIAGDGVCKGNCSLRSIVMRCPVGACLGGLCESQGKNESCCAPGRTGPLCAVCLPGRALVGNECYQCVDSSLTVSSVFLGIGLLIVWYILAWRPVVETKGYKLHPLHILAYIVMSIYAFFHWILAYVVKKNANGNQRTQREKGQSLSKALRAWCMNLYLTARDKGVMSYTKV
jgi:hypothetical protein